MASSTAADGDDEVVREFGPILRVYKSGRLERPLGGAAVEVLETAGAGHVFHLFEPDGDKAKELLDRMVTFVNGAGADAA
uniref:Alpha/beta hydrolase fold-3 domain-containing protein n=1 Tax=Oryza barthii TaxID=65489 RepID=A0A0D3F6L1_9ORYZ